MLNLLKNLSFLQAYVLFWIENIMIVLGVLGISYWFRRKYANRNLGNIYDTINKKEIVLTTISVTVNTAVTFAGYWLWLNNYIRFDESFSYRVLTDFFILICVMDTLMFFLHFLVHKTFLFKFIHKLHHMETEPQPIDLFVLDPFETISFGSLWLILLMFFTANIWAVVGYMVANVVFGMFGHMTVEPFPKYWLKHRVLKFITTSTFHYQHHNDEQHNFGFYTTFWDQIFGTLSPDYDSTFSKTVEGNKSNT